MQHKLAQLTKDLKTAREELVTKNLKMEELQDQLKQLLESNKPTIENNDKLIKQLIKEIEDKILTMVVGMKFTFWNILLF